MNPISLYTFKLFVILYILPSETTKLYRGFGVLGVMENLGKAGITAELGLEPPSRPEHDPIYFPIFRKRRTVLPGTMVVGSTPFHFSAATRVGRLGLLRRASPRAWMAPASALP